MAESSRRIIDTPNDYGQTPLHLAARNRTPGTLHSLIDLGADMGAKDKCGRTALHVAAECGLCNSVDILAGAWADFILKEQWRRASRVRIINCSRASRSQSLDSWTDEMRLKLVEAGLLRELYVPGQTVEPTEWIGYERAVKALSTWPRKTHSFATADDNKPKDTLVRISQALELLSPKTADTTAIDQILMTIKPSAGTPYERLKEIVEDQSLDFRARSHDEFVGLVTGLVVCVGIRKDVVNTQDNKQQTPLHLAANNRHGRVVETLLKSGADANIKDMNGQTALHLAAIAGSQEIISMLLQDKADTHIRDKNDQTPLLLSVGEHHKSFIDILNYEEAKLQDKAQVFNFAIQTENEAVMEILLKKKSKAAIQGELGLEALRLAVNKKWQKVLFLLVEGGVDVTGEGGTEALKLAVEDGWSGMKDSYAYHWQQLLYLLLENGAKVTGAVGTDLLIKAANRPGDLLQRLVAQADSDALDQSNTLWRVVDVYKGLGEMVNARNVLEFVNLLKSKGVRLDQSYAGSTPLERAAQKAEEASEELARVEALHAKGRKYQLKYETNRKLKPLRANKERLKKIMELLSPTVLTFSHHEISKEDEVRRN